MAAPFAKGFSAAYKRARSHDSPTPLASPPVLKATKIQEQEEVESGDSDLPDFLRQSQIAIRAKYNDLVWQEKLRLLHGRNDPASRWVQEVNPQVAKRNRYMNIIPWEKSRIRLNVAEGYSDYINASPVTLRDARTGAETRYIATQGPQQTGLSHFWQMIWQETKDVAVIIMLTQTHDGAQEKCYQYFPLDAEAGSFKVDPIDQSEDHPEGSVSFIEKTSDARSKTEIRKLSLQFGESRRDVWHFLFSGWPDFAVPEDHDRSALLELFRLSAEKNVSASNPRIIHCSAGVGRSGTFIALEHLLAQVESGAIADVKDDHDMIYDVVNELREQRMSMVQMESQYQFLYEVVKELYTQRKAAISASGHPSPKLRKLASGMKATLIGEANEQESTPTEDSEGQVDEGEGKATIKDEVIEGQES